MSHQEIIDKDTDRTTGGQVRHYNLLAAKMIKDLVQNFFGPQGREKIYIDIIGESTLTKDGATFLRKIDVGHPAAKVLIDASNTVDNEVGDGTTSVVIIAGSLLEKAEDLLKNKFSPATIINGFDIGLRLSLELLHSISIKESDKDFIIMEKIAKSCLGTKIISSYNPHETSKVVEITVNAIKTIYNNNNNVLEIDDIKIEEKIGNTSDSQLINGILIDKTIDNGAMPKFIENANILLLDEELGLKRTRADAEISVNSPNQMQLFINKENEVTKSKIQSIINCGANVVVSRKGIDSRAQDYMSKFGIMSIKRVKENDLHWLEKATGGKITKEISSHDLKENLGYAGKVYEKTVGDDKMVFVEGCKSPKSVTILLRANSKMILDEYHRAVLSTLKLIKGFNSKPFIVVGGGACEALIAQYIRKKALEFSGREQIVLMKFSEALEEIPLTLAKNSGMNVIDSLIQLKTKLSNSTFDENVKWVGINTLNKNIEELNSEIIEPSILKEQVLNTAVEVSSLLINIDDVLIKKPLMNTHTHEDGTEHAHEGGDKKHDHYFDKLGKQQRPSHHYY
ncbi:MAG: thermosome subunit [Thermoproteota archaeon]|nr:thermosome subunit [Thermoproteota archaeon]